jgi:CRP/FNR family transcriptional regulator
MPKPALKHAGHLQLSSIPAFEGLDAETLGLIATSAIRREYEAGQVVFLEGEPCAGLYFIEQGWLKSVKISPSGREQVIRFAGPGEVFNEIGVFAGGVPSRVKISMPRRTSTAC